MIPATKRFSVSSREVLKSMRRARYLTILVAALACRPGTPNVAPLAVAPTVAADSSVAPSTTAPPAAADSLALTPAERLELDAKLRAATDSLIAVFDSALLVPLPSTGAAPAAAEEAPDEEPSWDIDVRSYLTHDRVEFYLERFTGVARERVVSWMQRGTRFEPMIRSTFRDAGIPEDMYYLGLVESGYDPHAYSRAAAVGMWQFMTTTAKGMGLRVDWWMDERRDPIKSTKAAARFLSLLKDQFGSFYLAAAAYNGGPGRVSRGLARHASAIEESEGEDRFFALAGTGYLRSETSNYVPQLIAAALIGKDPARYGIRLETLPPFAYDSVEVPAETPIAAVAAASGRSLDDIRDLNPHLIRGIVPPGKALYVRVPVGTGEAFPIAFAALDETERVGLTRLKTKSGMTLASLAKQHGITSTQLRAFNPRLKTLKSGKISSGQSVMVPSKAVVLAARDVPDPAIERYGRTVRGASVHVVRKGESLGLIAKRYRTTVATLVRLNGLKKHVIYAGQTIIVRGSSSPRTSSRSRSTSSSGRSRSPAASAKVAKTEPPAR
jgi:membrane-bound lytic murein transglycosylase D